MSLLGYKKDKPVKKIVLATSNPGKLRDFQVICAGLDIQFVSQVDLGVVDADETAETFLENALLKARHAAKETGLPAIADDSGLCVPALQGAPGVYSARYAGTRLDLDNNLKLLKEMQALRGQDRAAYFCCTLVFVMHEKDPNPLVFQGIWQGEIASELRGEGGFGYNPVFFLPKLGKTAAELDNETRNRLNHRGVAMQNLLTFLRINRGL
jgi:XTP/dITP diphosphohydrolase